MGFISDLLIEITSFRIRVGNKLNKLWGDIGNKANLTTTDKSNLVSAINEVNGNSSKRVSTAISQGVNWYRIARGTENGGRGCSFIIIVERSYGNTSNESYTFSVNTAYNGKTTITQLSGTYNQRILTKIRVVNTIYGGVDVDVFYNHSVSNTLFVRVIGSGEAVSATIAPEETTGVTELDTTLGVRTTDNIFANNRVGSVNGFEISGRSNSDVVLAGGGHRPVSDFALASDIPNVTGFIPYTEANQPVNLNTQRLLTDGVISTTNGGNVINLVSKTVASNQSANSLVFEIIKGSGSNMLMGTFSFELFRYTGINYKFNISTYIYQNNWYVPTVTWASGYSSDISAINFLKKSDSEFYIEIVFASNFSYMTAKVDWLGYMSPLEHGFNLYRGSEIDLTTSTISFTRVRSQFTRDDYLWNRGNFSQTDINNWNAAFGWGNFRDYGLGGYVSAGAGSSPDTLGNNTGFYLSQNSPTEVGGTHAKIINLGNLSFSNVVGQIAIGHSTNRMAFRNSLAAPWLELYHTGNFNPAQYVMISDLNTQLANYVPINGVTTINNTKTFTSSPIVPNATLNGHAVNLGQLNTILGDYALASAIPTNNNQLINGAGYITASALGGYVQQSSLNTQLANYATLAGTQTFTGQNTFTQAPYIPAGTLNGHAVNLGQLNSIIDNFDFVTDEALNSYIKKGVHNENPEGQPFSIHANYGTLDWNGNGFSFVTDSEQEFSYIEDEQAIGVNPFQDYGFYLSGQRLRFTSAGVSSELLPSNGVSKSKLPVTGSTQRTLAVGATMGESTYYANENGIINLPNITPPSINTTVKAYMPGDVFNNDTIHCSASKTIIYLSPTFAGPLHISVEPDLQDGSELIVIHTSNEDFGLFNINGEFISHGGQLISTYQASQSKTYRFVYVKDYERFALVDVGQV